jgi:uncharacterized membrane protein
VIPPALAAHFPLAAFVAGCLALAAYARWAWTRTALRRRPVLIGAALLAVLTVLYFGLTWTRWISDSYLRLERPTLAVPCALAVLFVVNRLLGLSPRQSAWRRMLTELLVCAAALSASWAAIGLELGRPLDRLAVIVAIDRSRSIDLVPHADSRIRAELQVAEIGMRPHDRIGTVAFAATAAVEDPLRPHSTLPAPERVEIGRDGTDIGAAIRRALSEVPSDAAARIAVISDGVNTRGDPIGAAAAAVAAGVPVDVVPLDQEKLPDVRVVGLRMPSRANQGETMELRIVTSSTSPTPVEVRLYRDGQLVRKGHTKIPAGEDVLSLSEQAPGPGLHRYDVELSALDPKADQAPEDNSGSSFVRVRGESNALIMQQNPALAAALANAFRAAAFHVDVVGPGGVPADVAGFAAYDLVVLSDISAVDLSPTQISALASYVRDLGGGLLLMGGERSMGPGGYGKTPIEEVSPVSFDLKQERRRASLAEIIIIDYSGSMGMSVGGHTKLELANEAAARSAALLGTGDHLGVMHVDTAVRWTVPLGPVKDKAAIEKAIRSVGVGGGGIYIDLSLKAAYAALSTEKVNLKHVLLFSDGDDAEQRTHAFALAAAAKAHGITTSVVALGRGSDVPALEHISKIGTGRFYLIEDASRLPAVFAQETILAARSAINETTFRPSVSAIGPATRGVDFSAEPPLTGYVVTIPKGRAQVLLRGPEGDPILATWSVGIGRAGAFTSDYKDRWGLQWTSWAGAARMFGQLGRDLARLADDPRVRLEADASGGELHVRATVVDDDGRAESFRRLTARVAGPDGFEREVALEAVGAGAYAATLPLSRPGPYITTVVDDLSKKPVGTTGAVLSAGEELRPTGSDRALLKRIATLTGGKVRDTLAGIFKDREKRRFAYQDLSSLLVVLAALALLFSVAARRLQFPEAIAGWPARARARARLTADRRAVTSRLETRAQPSARASPRVVDDALAPSVPRFATAPPSTSPPARQEPRHDAPPRASTPALSAAEILLARRRGRRS